MNSVYSRRTCNLLVFGVLIGVAIKLFEVSILGQIDPGTVDLTWSKLPPLPDNHGFAGAFAGVSNGALIVAGGANFPEKPPWEGGKKIWTDKIFVLERPGSEWKSGFTLPFPNGYGVSVTTDRGLLCIGGADADKHYADVFLLEWVKGKIKRTPLPSLPKPLAYASGARVGNTIYIAGGTETPTSTVALKGFWSLDLAQRNARWKELEPWPGPGRLLSVSGSHGRGFYVFSGASLSSDTTGKPLRTYLKDAYRFLPETGWQKLADLPHSVTAAPTPAASVKGSRLIIIGGDDGTKAGFQPIERHPGFARRILSYEIRTDTWADAGTTPATHVTTSSVRWHGGFVIPSGEIRPGVRSPEVWFVRGVR
ncbi:MAG: hypothetical protein WBD22_05285 [Pyrinomonadaceae bacterium]